MKFESLPPDRIARLIVDSSELLTDAVVGINGTTDPDGNFEVLNASKPLNEATRVFLGRFAVEVDDDYRAANSGDASKDRKVHHGMRLRTGGKNLRQFAHTDLPGSGMLDAFKDLLDGEGQYVFTTEVGIVYFPGAFKMPAHVPRIGTLAQVGYLQFQTRNRPYEELDVDTIHHLTASTVHSAPLPETYRGANRVFLGDYAEWHDEA